MADLWLAVTTGNPRFGLPGFFPVAAYKQVKAEPYPVADWQDRLWYDFVLDVRAATAWPAPGTTGPRYRAQGVRGLGLPGSCHNEIGYWHVPGTRVVYREHGKDSRSASPRSSPGGACGMWCTSVPWSAPW